MKISRIPVLTLVLLLMAWIAPELHARGGGGGSFGGSRSSSSSSSRSSGSSSSRSSSSGWGSSKPAAAPSAPSATAPAKSWGTSKPATTAPAAPAGSGAAPKPAWGASSAASAPSAPAAATNRMTGSPTASAADRAAADKAKMAGKAFTNKTEAITDFKSKARTDPAIQKELAGEYPTSFSTPPPVRPAYIPERYNGNVVVFNNGGYGYYNGGSWTPLATYMLLDTIGDVAMMNAMHRQGYYIGNYPSMYDQAPMMYVHRHSFFFYFFWTAVGIVVVIAAVSIIGRRMS